MKRSLLLLLGLTMCASLFAQENVGIGITDPASRLHIHKATGQYTALQLTNNSTGTESFDGMQFLLNGVGDALLYHYGDNILSLGTQGLHRLVILGNGDIAINRTAMIAAADFTIRSYNPSRLGRNVYREYGR